MCHQIFYHPHPESDGFIVGTASIRGDRSPHECTRIEITDGRESITLNFIHNKNGHKETFLETLQAAIQEELDNIRSQGLTAYQPVFPDHTCGTILAPVFAESRNATERALAELREARKIDPSSLKEPYADEPFNPAAFDAEMGEPVVGQEVSQ